MKKRIITLALVMLMLIGLSLPASAAGTSTVKAEITYRGISIVVNGTEIAPCDENGNPTEPFIMNSTTYLPVRAIANALGLGVEWIPATSTIALTSGGEVNYGSGEPAASNAAKTVDITYRGTNISLDGKALPLVNGNGQSVEPFIMEGTNYLPLRIVGEALGLTVQWDSATSTVTLSSKAAEKVWVPAGMRFTGGVTGNYAGFTELINMKYEYDAAGRLTRFYSTDTRVDLRCSYDSKGNITELHYRVPGENASYAWDYDAGGNVTAYYENGKLKDAYSCEKDSLGRIVKESITENGNSYVNEYTYDEKGRLASEKPGQMWGTYFEYAYDEFDRVVTKFERDPNFTEAVAEYRYGYDARGNLISEEYVNHSMDVIVHEKTFTYDTADRLSTETGVYYCPQWTAAEGHSYGVERKEVTTYNYAADGELLSYKTDTYSAEEADGVVTYSYMSSFEKGVAYDSTGNLTREYVLNTAEGYYDIVESTWAYDSAGRLVEERHGSTFDEGYEVWKYGYDASGNLISEAYDDQRGTSIAWYEYSWTYNSKGLVTKSSYSDYADNTAYEQYLYDYLDRLVSYTVTENGAATRTTVQYNAEDLPTRMETVSYGEGVTVITEMSYVLQPKAEMDSFLAALVDQIENML